MTSIPSLHLPTAGPGVPSQDGLRLILAGMAYLVAICALQLVATVGSVASGPNILPRNAMDVRDVVALFGWVGLMICGVSVIIVPNHLKTRVRPAYLPRLHLGVANFGLVGYFASSLLLPGSTVSDAFLTVVSGSFLLFGVGVLSTVLPFLHRTGARVELRTQPRPTTDDRQLRIRPDGAAGTARAEATTPSRRGLTKRTVPPDPPEEPCPPRPSRSRPATLEGTGSGSSWSRESAWRWPGSSTRSSYR